MEILVLIFLVALIYHLKRDYRLKHKIAIDRNEAFERRLSEIPERQLLFLYNRKAYEAVLGKKPWDELDIEIDRQIRTRDFNLEKLKACHFNG